MGGLPGLAVSAGGPWVAGTDDKAACQKISGINALLCNTLDPSVGALFLANLFHPKISGQFWQIVGDPTY